MAKLKKEFKFNNSIFGMIRYIVSKTKKSERRTVKDLFIWYSELSKLAHFGSRTLQIIESRFVSSEEVVRDFFYKDVIETVLLFSYSLLVSYASGEKISPSIVSKYEELCNIQRK